MRSARIGVATVALTLALCAPATARDPGRWTLTGWSSVPNNYWQGVTQQGPGGPSRVCGREIGEGVLKAKFLK